MHRPTPDATAGRHRRAAREQEQPAEDKQEKTLIRRTDGALATMLIGQISLVELLTYRTPFIIAGVLASARSSLVYPNLCIDP